jgi:hypothetical protein
MKPWLNLTPQEFEEFCYSILERNGFKNLQWYGKGGGDKGRDIICTKSEAPLPGLEKPRRWVVQCKHYAKAKVTKALMQEWLAACREHRPDRVLLIVSQSLTAGLKDWLESIRPEYTFEIHTWQELDLQWQYHRHGAQLRRRFPQLPKVRKPLRVWHAAGFCNYVGCEGMEEGGFYVYNAFDDKDVMERVREFVDFIKANDFKFDGLRT